MVSLKSKVPLAACAAFILTAGSLSADVVLTATSRGNRQLLLVNLTTNTLTVLRSTFGFPDSLVTDPQGRIVYDESDTSTLHRFDPISHTDTILADSSNGLNDPTDLLLEPGGNSILVSNFGGGTITRTNLTTGATSVFATVQTPEGLAYDAAGRLYAAIGYGTANNRVVELNSAGGIVRSSVAFDPTNSLDGMTFDSFSGKLYVSSMAGNKIYQIDPATLVATPFSTVPGPDGIITNSAGLLYVAARGDFRVYSVNVTSGASTALTPVPGIDDLGAVALNPPNITKTFGAAGINLNGSTSLTFVINNSNAVPLTNVNFVDSLPAGLVVATPNGLSGTCGGGTITATAGATSVSLAGASIAASGSCTFSVNVTGTAIGTLNNCVTASASNAGPGNTSCAPLVVSVLPIPPSVAKAFGAPTIAVGGSTTLSFTITNTGLAPLTAVGISDTLPAGLSISSPNGLNPPTGCNGTVPTATAGSTSVSLAGVSLAAGASCTFAINVNGNTAGVQNNTVTVTSSAGPGNPGTATLTVIGPPVLTKAFAPASVTLNGGTTLTFTINNPNAVALTGIAFTDTLPAGTILASPSGVTSSCPSGTITAPSGTNTITSAALNLPANSSCTFSVNVTGTALGSQVNVTSVITSTNGGNGGVATATLTVTPPAPPPIDDTFQLKYAANLNVGDSFINFTNAGTLSGSDPAGRICVNVYTFDPAEELVSCCACPVTPNGLASLSVRNDLISNTLTPGVPTSVTIKLLASTPVSGTCNAASPTSANLVRGMRAWGTTLHALTAAAPVTYQVTETPFSVAVLSPSELAKLSSFCGFIQANGSGFGICSSCRSGALGGATK